MKKVILLVLACSLLTGCISAEVKSAVVRHNEIFQAYVRDDLPTTTPEQDKAFIRAHAASVAELTRLIAGD